MNVNKLMTRNVRTCRPEDPMQLAAQVFWDNDCGCVPVVDHEARVVGMITDRDVCMAAYTQGRTLANMPIASAMTTNVHSCQPTDSVATAEQMMRTNRVRRLPVIDSKQHLVGVISLNDIAQEAARERNDKKQSVTDAEVAQTLSAVCTPRAANLAVASA